MAHLTSVSRLLLLSISGLAFAGCGSSSAKFDTPREIAAVASADAPARAAAYAERLRLGLGSPYRLIDIAAHDPQLGPNAADVARRLFAQIESGKLYEVSPYTLTTIGVPAASAVAQLELMEKAVTSAREPATGELAINLAYELAVAEKAASPALAARASRIAALLRDRALALADARRLRDAARRARVSPEALVPAWRTQRLFAVEQPTLAPLSAAAQDEAARLALLLVGGIRTAVLPVSGVVQRTVPVQSTLLDPEAARVLLADSASTPQSALVVTLRALRPLYPASRWQDFFNDATDEQRFVAALSLARQQPVDDVPAAGMALEAAVALRPFAQERVAADTALLQDLKRRFGVNVRFGAKVSDGQRAQAARQLSSALTDLRIVIRTLDVSGLTFEVAPIAAAAPHLAFHDPLRRVIRLDPSTMAGTIAHEVAHDLDWQLATRKYRARANYATDFATRNRRALAFTVESLSAAAADMAQAQHGDGASRRPAEIFARRFEWYVAGALALQGRSNGYLSSVQSDWLTGYGSAVRPEAAAAAAASFAGLVAEATRMDRSDLAQVRETVIESSPVITRVLRRVDDAADAAQARQRSLGELRAWECTTAWHSESADRSALYAFVDVLTASVHRTEQQELLPMATVAPVRTVDGAGLGLAAGGCSRISGVFLAPSVR